VRALPWFLLVACAHLQHLDPAPRTPATQALDAVSIEVSCVERDPFWRPYPEGDGRHPAFHRMWGGGAGEGVLISGRHVLTTAHVVRCPVIPRVRVHLRDGRAMRAVVEREDARHDLARLVILTDEFFLDGVVPPMLRDVYDESVLDETLCLRTADGRARCGEVGLRPVGEHVADYALSGDNARRGNSGAGVYDGRGRLVGILTSMYFSAAGEHVSDGFSLVDGVWLEGT
jgi:S1-C subfamily serine protease